MTLPAVLEELAVLLPERIKIQWDDEPGWGMVRVHAEDFWHTVLELKPTGCLPVFRCAQGNLEAALREECEARGWMWSIRRSADNGNEAAVQAKPRGRVYACSVIKELAPVEAFVGAMIQALKSEAAISESAAKLK